MMKKINKARYEELKKTYRESIKPNINGAPCTFRLMDEDGSVVAVASHKYCHGWQYRERV